MATTQFQSVTVTNFTGPDNNGTMKASVTSLPFQTNVITAGVALQEFGAVYAGGNHWVYSLSASISNVQAIGTQVSFDAEVHLIDSANNKIENATMIALVIASTE